jgi:hypothetical protein
MEWSGAYIAVLGHLIAAAEVAVDPAGTHSEKSVP